MSRQGRGPAPQPDLWAELVADLRSSFRWLGDKVDDGWYADPTGWWANGSLLRRLGPWLSDLFGDLEGTDRPTVVAGTQSRGTLLGGLVAAHLGVGLVEVVKDQSPATDSERWLTALTPPDYRDRTLRLSARRDHLRAGQRVLFVDEWIATGGQALGAHALVCAGGATWCGAAVVIDGLTSSRLRRDLAVRSLLHIRDL